METHYESDDQALFDPPLLLDPAQYNQMVRFNQDAMRMAQYQGLDGGQDGLQGQHGMGSPSKQVRVRIPPARMSAPGFSTVTMQPSFPNQHIFPLFGQGNLMRMAAQS
jgi:hypothetical protein